MNSESNPGAEQLFKKFPKQNEPRKETARIWPKEEENP